jgi:hypothetical protein
MTTYVFECGDGHQVERDFPIGQFPPTVECHCGKDARKIIVGASPQVEALPGYMKANGQDAVDRQAKWLASPEHYNRCKRLEARGANIKFGSEVESG